MSDILKHRIVDNVGWITLNRPEKKNTLSPDLLLELNRILRDWAAGETVRAVVITGSGDRAFSAGYDIAAIPTAITPEDADLLKDSNPLALALETLKNYPYPTIAMLNGYAYGAGLNLAICCDIRIGAEDIAAGMPPARLGLVYHPDGLAQFVEVLGMTRTRELFLTAATYRGPDLAAMGIVNRLVPRILLLETVSSMAAGIASNAPLSLKGMKHILNRLAGRSALLSEEDLDQVKKLVTEAFNSEDLKEGQTAFMEKRPPVFHGK
jgi:enoyl-CoA hydratase